MVNNSNSRRRRRKNFSEQRKEDFIYFEDGVVTESLPATTFKVRVKRLTKDKITGENKELEPMIIICQLRAKLIKRRVQIIKGDNVVVEVNPMDMFFDEANNILKGTIIERK